MADKIGRIGGSEKVLVTPYGPYTVGLKGATAMSDDSITSVSVAQCHCPLCGRQTKRRIKTTCRACYQKARYKVRPAAACHPGRKEHAGGFCRECYNAGDRAKRAICHPDRLHVAGGLCRKCYNDLPERKARSVKARRLKKYGLTDQQYEMILQTQGWVCAICGDTPIAVDHDHQTGKVRGVLCRCCNTGLGHFKDKAELLVTAASYLEKHPNAGA